MGVEKSLTEVREQAQALGISDIFSKSKLILEQEISLKKEPEIIAKEPIHVVISDAPVDDILQPFIARGLNYHVSDDRWYMSYDNRTDEGGVEMPIAHIVKCAERIMA